MNPRQIFEANLRGADYLRERGLTPTIQRTRPPTWEEVNQPFNEKLPAVLQILESERKRTPQKIRRIR